jgi:hypothetical protein
VLYQPNFLTFSAGQYDDPVLCPGDRSLVLPARELQVQVMQDDCPSGQSAKPAGKAGGFRLDDAASLLLWTNDADWVFTRRSAGNVEVRVVALPATSLIVARLALQARGFPPVGDPAALGYIVHCCLRGGVGGPRVGMRFLSGTSFLSTTSCPEDACSGEQR